MSALRFLPKIFSSQQRAPAQDLEAARSRSTQDIDLSVLRSSGGSGVVTSAPAPHAPLELPAAPHATTGSATTRRANRVGQQDDCPFPAVCAGGMFGLGVISLIVGAVTYTHPADPQNALEMAQTGDRHLAVGFLAAGGALVGCSLLTCCTCMDCG